MEKREGFELTPPLIPGIASQHGPWVLVEMVGGDNW